MTPKEQAQELFDNYYIVCQEFTEEIQCSIQAKQCALIAVDLTLEFADSSELSCYEYRNTIEYLQQVKQEIEKL